MVVATHSAELAVDGLGAVALTLGERFAALRTHVLRDLVPRLDDTLTDVAEEDELPWVLEALAADPHDLLDPRHDGDLGVRAATVAVEALATGRQSYLIPVLVNALSRMPIVLAGDDEQQARFLARGGRSPVGAFAMTEEQAGSDVAGLETVARRTASGYVLDGRKRWITVQDPGRLEWIVVWAKADGGGAHDLSCFIVPAGAAGVTITRRGRLLGMRSVPVCDITLEAVEVDAGHRIGEHGRAFGLAMRCLNSVRCVVAARGLGLTARVLMDAADLAQERRAFGGTMADRQPVRATLADLAARLEAVRLLTYRSAAIADARRLGKTDGPVLGAAKYLATELAVEAATKALHLAGALGYDEDASMFPRHLRDAQQLTLVEGVSEVQLELVGYGVLARDLWWNA